MASRPWWTASSSRRPYKSCNPDSILASPTTVTAFDLDGGRATRCAQRYVQEGRRFVVDVDLAKFFDRVNHDVLMGKLETRIGDRRMLGLIRRSLDAGVMVSGVVIERREGTPQGGPLSPLLANVLLDEVDKELERRGHAFVRYADDCNVYVRSRKAGQRVLAGLRKQYERLRLQVNEAKSAVDLAVRRQLLGFSFWVAAEGRIKLRLAGKALTAMKAKVRELSNRNRGRSVPAVTTELAGYLNGWRESFKLADTPDVFRDLDKWIRRRLTLSPAQAVETRENRVSRAAGAWNVGG